MLGNIYIGYQGIGKTSTSKEHLNYIDLESSSFKLEDGSRSKDWFKYYVNIAFSLALQGYNVFVSSHDLVRKHIALINKIHNEVKVIAIYPSIKLKESWLERLNNRYKDNPTTKNKIAYLYAVDNFDKNIKEIEVDCYEYHFEEIKIDSVDYKLINKIINNP